MTLEQLEALRHQALYHLNITCQAPQMVMADIHRANETSELVSPDTLDLADHMTCYESAAVRTQFTARLPEPLASALATQAQANHRSANAELTAILRDALSGTPSTRLVGSALFSHKGIVAVDMDALAPYKAALQRLIDDSAALREKYEDLDAAVEQARALL